MARLLLMIFAAVLLSSLTHPARTIPEKRSEVVPFSESLTDSAENTTITITRPAGEYCWIVMVLIPPDAKIVDVQNVSGFNRIVLFRELFFRCYKFACIVFEVTNVTQPDIFNLTYTRVDSFQGLPAKQDELADPVMYSILEGRMATANPLFWNMEGISSWKAYPHYSVNKTENFTLPGPRCEYLVILPEDWLPIIQPLIEWKQAKGLATYTATVEWINQTYKGKDIQWRIREFIKDAFNVWQIRYVLLAGGGDFIPSRQILEYREFPYPNFTTVNDAYYACLDGTWDENENNVFNEIYFKHPIRPYLYIYEADWLPELIIGRLPAANETELSTVIDKILRYEQQPPRDTWFNNFLGIAGWGGSRMYRPYFPPYLNQTWLEGDSTTGFINSTTRAVIDYLNEGQGLVLHKGHGGPTGWQVARATGEGLLSENVSSLVNGEKLPIVFSEGCNTVRFSSENNIAATFLKNPNGGAVLYIGSTGLGRSVGFIRDWLFGERAHCTWGSGGFEGCSWSELSVGCFRPGVAFFQGGFMGSAINTNAEPISLLGDPEMAWTSRQRSLNVTLPDTVLTGQDLLIEVKDKNSSEPLQSVTLRVIANNTWTEISTNQTGQAVLKIPNHACTLNLTVYALFRNSPTKIKCTVRVADYPVASFTYSPPVPYHTLFVRLPVYFDASASYDPDGSITSYEWDFGKGYSVGTSQTGISTSYTIAGNYTVTLTVTDNEGLTDTTTSTITVSEPINPQEGEVTLYPIDDTYTDSNNPDENYGGQTTFYASNTTGKIAWLKFGLCAVPDGAVVDYARLKLHALQPTETYDVYAHSCSDNSWMESTLTYSNMPGFNISHIMSAYRFSYEGWGDWEVSEGVRKAIDGIYDGPDIMTLVVSGIPTHHISEASYISFHSKESLHVPELTVHWIGTDAPEDTTPPTISITSPENKTYPERGVSLTFNTSESTCWIGYSLDGQANMTITGNTTLTGLSDGTHRLVVHAGDMAGNVGSSDIICFTIDTTPPTISILSPENKTYDTPDSPLTFTVDESVSWIAYSLDNNANVTITGNTTLTDLPEGSHNLIVYANDTVGNMGGSDIVYFSIETPQPELFPIEIVAVIGIIAVIGAIVFICFTKLKK